MKRLISLASTALVLFLTYNAIEYYNRIANNLLVEYTTFTSTVPTSTQKRERPWEKCESPSRYVFLKKHKVASRCVIFSLSAKIGLEILARRLSSKAI